MSQAGIAGRHFGLDWLRITAFALLILYHLGMFFVPWDWHFKYPAPAEWLTLPMRALNPWRLLLLFVVSGYASRMLLSRSSLTAFARYRSVQLGLPLLFGICVIVAPQTWIEMTAKHGYDESFWHFWSRDYFAFAQIAPGLIAPTWNHLWFIAYLLVYTWVLALLAALPGSSRAQIWADKLSAGGMVLAAPLLWLIAVRAVVFPGVKETHALVDDLAAHLVYFPAFLFGFALARSQRLWDALHRCRKPALLLWLLATVAIVASEAAAAGIANRPAWVVTLDQMARAVAGWSAIVSLLGLADAYLNVDHRWRGPLARGVFPVYIAHQTAIIVAAWYLLPFGLHPILLALAIAAITLAASLLFWRVGEHAGPLAPLFGLTRR